MLLDEWFSSKAKNHARNFTACAWNGVSVDEVRTRTSRRELKSVKHAWTLQEEDKRRNMEEEG